MEVLKVQEAIQTNILNVLQSMAINGSYWSYGSWYCAWLCEKGIKGYLDDSYLQSQLGKLNTPKNLEIAKMLCFEAINLGIIVNGKVINGKKDLTCAIEFTKANPELVKKIAKEHPEYFVDGLIVKQLISDPAELERLLGRNFDGKAMFNHDEESYWYQYSKEGMNELLQLRLESSDIKQANVITPNYVWDDSLLISEKLTNEILAKLSADKTKILIPLNLYNKHWVGIIVDKSKEGINVTYIDPEQNVPPILLESQLINQIASNYPEYKTSLITANLEPQKYNNCGPEVIEHFISYLIGSDRSISQEDATLIHSLLLEDSLLIGATGAYWDCETYIS